MKNVIAIFYGMLFTTLFSSPLKAQGWELFLSGPVFDDAPFVQFKFFLGPASGFRIAHFHVLSGTIVPDYLNYNANGAYVNNLEIPDTDDWAFMQSDNTGATYWLTTDQVKKLDPNNQIVWTYSISGPSNLINAKPGPNGSTYVEHASGTGEMIIDVLNRDGIEEAHFVFDNIIPSVYKPTADMGLVFRNGSTSFWTKLNRAGNSMWTKQFSGSTIIHFGAADGTYYHTNSNNQLVKLDTLGNVVWTTNLSLQTKDAIALSDGNIGLALEGNNDTIDFIRLMKIDAQTGAIIWSNTTSAGIMRHIFHFLDLYEMPDGGLITASIISDFDYNYSCFVMRTDADGNTNSNLITGNVFRDIIDNCSRESIEKPLTSVSVFAEADFKVYSATTDSLGNFSMLVGKGNYFLSYGQLGAYWKVCTMPFVGFTLSHQTKNINIGMKTFVECPELVVSIGTDALRSCFDANLLVINYQNNGTAPAENAYVDLVLPSQMQLESSEPIDANPLNGQNFRFELGTLDVGERGQIYVKVKVDCAAEIGEVLCASANIFPAPLCPLMALNHVENRVCLPVTQASSANDKTAFINGIPEPNKVALNAELEYLIRFQNTGNDTALNIVILDTLTTLLDPASVQPGASSHPYTFELINGHILRFSFRNILLPDSTTNEAASHGFVKFMVRQSATNVIGNEIKNNAAIYFDYNEPVITNETKLVITLPIATAEAKSPVIAQIFPVPARDRAQVTLLNTNGAAILWRVFDITGKLVSSGQATNTGSFDIPRNSLPTGVYHCQFLMDDGQMANGKIMFE